MQIVYCVCCAFIPGGLRLWAHPLAAVRPTALTAAFPPPVATVWTQIVCTLLFYRSLNWHLRHYVSRLTYHIFVMLSGTECSEGRMPERNVVESKHLTCYRRSRK